MAERKSAAGRTGSRPAAASGEATAPAASPEAPAPEPEAEAPKPTPESIGIEGVVRVGGHHLDDERGWVPDSDEE